MSSGIASGRSANVPRPATSRANTASLPTRRSASDGLMMLPSSRAGRVLCCELGDRVLELPDHLQAVDRLRRVQIDHLPVIAQLQPVQAVACERRCEQVVAPVLGRELRLLLLVRANA